MRASLVVLLSACSSGVQGIPGTQISMDFTRPTLGTAPFPSDDLAKADGTIDLTKFPNIYRVPLIDVAKQVLAGEPGYGLASGVFFQLTDAIDPAAVPAIDATTGPGATVFLTSIDAASPDFGDRYPI